MSYDWKRYYSDLEQTVPMHDNNNADVVAPLKVITILTSWSFSSVNGTFTTNGYVKSIVETNI